MKAHELIDRLASRLDEQGPVEEPVIEPGTIPEEPEFAPDAPPAPRRTRSPYELPPDFEPGQMPHPKAENDETDSISNWLEATQQPVQDWEWDGHELRMLMDDGTTEVYSRRQLEEVGIFGQAAFAESEESGAFNFSPEDLESDGEETIEENPVFGEPAPEENAAGTLDMILGRTPCSACSDTETEMAAKPEVISVEGEKAEELTAALGDVVSAILGLVQGDEGFENKPEEEDDDSDSEKDGKPKKTKKKAKDDDDEGEEESEEDPNDE